jgi:hypothetical protein
MQDKPSPSQSDDHERRARARRQVCVLLPTVPRIGEQATKLPLPLYASRKTERACEEEVIEREG